MKKLREVIQETYFSTALPLSLPKSPAKVKGNSQRSSRDMEDSTSLDESAERGSVASFSSGNTTDSDKVGFFLLYYLSRWRYKNCIYSYLIKWLIMESLWKEMPVKMKKKPKNYINMFVRDDCSEHSTQVLHIPPL